MYWILDAADIAHAVPADHFTTLCGTDLRGEEWVDADEVGDNDGGLCPTCATTT